MTPLQKAAKNLLEIFYTTGKPIDVYVYDLRRAFEAEQAQQVVVPAWTIAAERVPLSESLIGEFYMGVAGAQPTLLTRQLFTGIVKAVEQAHNIKES